VTKRMVHVLMAGFVSIALTGCGDSSSATGAGGSGGAAAAMDDPYCSRFGLRYAPTCEGCPAQPLECPCAGQGVAEGVIEPLQRCNFGRCLLSVDCAEICRAWSAVLSSPTQSSPMSPDPLDEVLKFPSCVTDRACQVDSGCGATGKCVGESGAQSGKCTYGDRTRAGPSDCWSGICVPTPSGAAAAGGNSGAGGAGGAPGSGGTTNPAVSPIHGSCQDGMPGSYCGDDSHCPGGTCLVGFNSICTRGEVGNPCRGAGDCASGTFCVRAPMGSLAEFGVCRAGDAGDPCGEDAQCKSGACVEGACSSGENGTPASSPSTAAAVRASASTGAATKPDRRRM